MQYIPGAPGCRSFLSEELYVHRHNIHAFLNLLLTLRSYETARLVRPTLFSAPSIQTLKNGCSVFRPCCCMGGIGTVRRIHLRADAHEDSQDAKSTQHNTQAQVGTLGFDPT